MNAPLYDITVSYEENYEKGPVGIEKLNRPDFTYSSSEAQAESRNLDSSRQARTINTSFLGFPIRLPFGIPAGPLLNSKFMKAAFDWGFDVSTYKTVRAESFPCHPFPNVVPVDVKGELHPEQTPRVTTISHSGLLAVNLLNLSRIDSGVAHAPQNDRINITNSFGVPSQNPSVWQEDVKKALTHVGKGQLLILSLMGTVKPNQTQEEFIKDFAQAARLSKETGAKVLEANLSCPNIGDEGLVCYNTQVTEEVCKAIRKEIGDTPLVLKVGYFKDDSQLAKIAEIANNYGNAVASINTLQVEVVDEKGNQALPGKMRLKSGICGTSIKWAGLSMVEKLQKLRKDNNYSYEIVGVGGVMTPQDYQEYRNAGADLVQSATGAMWNPYLAYEIWKQNS